MEKNLHEAAAILERVLPAYNGWPAGLFSPFGGTFAAGGGANEHTFVAAVRRRILRVADELEGGA